MEKSFTLFGYLYPGESWDSKHEKLSLNAHVLGTIVERDLHTHLSMYGRPVLRKPSITAKRLKNIKDLSDPCTEESKGPKSQYFVLTRPLLVDLLNRIARSLSDPDFAKRAFIMDAAAEAKASCNCDWNYFQSLIRIRKLIEKALLNKSESPLIYYVPWI